MTSAAWKNCPAILFLRLRVDPYRYATRFSLSLSEEQLIDGRRSRRRKQGTNARVSYRRKECPNDGRLVEIDCQSRHREAHCCRQGRFGYASRRWSDACRRQVAQAVGGHRAPGPASVATPATGGRAAIPGRNVLRRHCSPPRYSRRHRPLPIGACAHHHRGPCSGTGSSHGRRLGERSGRGARRSGGRGSDRGDRRPTVAGERSPRQGPAMASSPPRASA